jgi:beta-lactam-binding protein with PASTA domain
MKSRNKFASIYVRNVLMALVILVAIFFVILQGLNVYTHHGKQVAVPDVKGMQVEVAGPFIVRQSLRYAVVDSMYVRGKVAGSILETVPPVGTNVKEGRTIYLTINAVTAHMRTLPQVIDMSQRQAEALLRSLGFETVRSRTVSGAYRDLVIGLETGAGVSLVAGQSLSINTPLILLVSSGQAEILVPDDDGIPLPEDSEAFLH